VADWCERWSIAQGALVSVEQCCELARRWYEGRASPAWRRRSAAAAEAIFRSVGLAGSFWTLG
jgi:hypothetical protein